MKTIEQKALAYDEAIRKAKKLYEKGTITESISYIFPEIEKSEDERIRTAIFNHLKKMWGNCKDDICGVHVEDAIAWLEKQESVEEIVARCKDSWYNEGKIAGMAEGLTDDEKYQQGWHDAIEKQVPVDKDKVVKGVKRGVATSLINYIDANSKGMCLSNMECEDIEDAIVNGKWYKVYNYMKKKLEKQGDKPQGKTAIEAVKKEKVDNANKVESKFHEGDWIVWENQYYKVNYNGCGYELVDQNGLSTSLEYGTVDESAHLWDITKDAKDGDVLAVNNEVFVYAHRKQLYSIAIAHCFVDSAGVFYLDGEFGFTEKGNSVHPATKEQRDILMKAMADAGYEWDAEKKELKKVEPKFKVKYAGKEDEQILLGIIGELEANKSEAPEYDIETYDKFIEWLKSIKERVQPQPKQEWSEEDEKIALSIKQVMNCASLLNLVPEKIEKVRAWLRSLKERIIQVE